MSGPSNRDIWPAGHTPNADAATVVLNEPATSRVPFIPATGSQIGQWVLGDILGTGGCGTVFEARHRTLGRFAAIKLLHHDIAQSDEMVERFARESHAANLIRHANIVDIWEVGRLPSGQPYFVMELLDGVNLGALLARGSLSPAEALEILEPVCAAVEAAHRAGIVHRDLKASNIQIGGTAGERRITLLDFGIAKLTELDGTVAQLTAMGRKLGTPSSMSPEQIRGSAVDSRTDIYALGVLLFYMLTCRHPFESQEALEIERMHLETPPPRPSDLVAVGGDLDAVATRCLAKNPADRFQTVSDFLDALRLAVARAGGPAAGARQLRPALAGALLVDVSLTDEALEAAEDALLVDLSTAIVRAEAMLVEAGTRVALQTGSAALGITLLSSDLEEQRGERLRLAERAAALYQELDGRAGKQAGVIVTVCVHVDQAMVAASGTGAAPDVSGPILSIGGWMPVSAGGLYLTAAAAEGIPEISIAKFKVIHNTQI